MCKSSNQDYSIIKKEKKLKVVGCTHNKSSHIIIFHLSKHWQLFPKEIYGNLVKKKKNVFLIKKKNKKEWTAGRGKYKFLSHIRHKTNCNWDKHVKWHIDTWHWNNMF